MAKVTEVFLEMVTTEKVSFSELELGCIFRFIGGSSPSSRMEHEGLSKNDAEMLTGVYEKLDELLNH